MSRKTEPWLSKLRTLPSPAYYKSWYRILKKYILALAETLYRAVREYYGSNFFLLAGVFFFDQNTDRYKTRGAGKLLYKNGTENKTLDSGWFEKSLFELVFSPPGGRGRTSGAISLWIWSLDGAVYAGEWVGAAEADATPPHRQGARPRGAISLGIWSLDVAVYAGE